MEGAQQLNNGVDKDSGAGKRLNSRSKRRFKRVRTWLAAAESLEGPDEDTGSVNDEGRPPAVEPGEPSGSQRQTPEKHIFESRV